MSLEGFLPFLTSSHQIELAYHGFHESWLVAVSVSMAILASFVSFFHRDTMLLSQKRSHRIALHIIGSISMGIGIWSMHFIGMISFQIDVPIHYDMFITAVSMLPGILAAGVTLFVLYRHSSSWKTYLLAGVLMGSGIGLMHYIGMAAILVNAEIRYIPSWFIISIIVAVLMALLALTADALLKPYIQNRYIRTGMSAVVMGLAVSSMHYTAMHATLFFPIPAEAMVELSGANVNQLVTSTLVTACLIVLMSIVVVLMIGKQRRLQLVAEATSNELEELNQRLYSVAARVPGVMYQLQRERDGWMSFKYVSPAVYSLFGVTADEAMRDAKKILDRLPLVEKQKLVESLNANAVQLEPWHHEFYTESLSGAARWFVATAQVEREVQGAMSWSGFISEITQRKKSEETIHKLAYYDDVTELPNRKHLRIELKSVIQQAVSNKNHVIMWRINLDGFKRVNDVHGQEQGDLLLKETARRLLRVSGLLYVARLAADEFILLEKNRAAHQVHQRAEDIATRILNELSQAFEFPRLRHQSSASIGIVVSELTDLPPQELLRRSDLAVRAAKQNGGNQWAYYDDAFEQAVSERFLLEQELRSALASQQLILYYQLQVDHRAKPIGAEALLRWQHPERGLISPAVFIPIAEESGLIVSLGEWVLMQACQQLARWQEQTETKGLTISVNVSAKQFYQHNFVQFVIRTLEEAGAKPEQLYLELTESIVLEDTQIVVEKMQLLQQYGVKFSMDDFGTGYSSLSYLSSLPFNEVKIDQAFIRRAASDEYMRDWTIVEAIIGISKKLGMSIIAEGVETELQQQRLEASGCLRYQGFLYSRPVPVEQLPFSQYS